jgi:molecular chaperone GrpE (heat shock protein)
MLPKLTKWPFLLGDVLLLGTAALVCLRAKSPLGLWELGLVAGCALAAAALAVLPFILEYRLQGKLAEADGLTHALDQIRNIDAVATQISGATGRWQHAQEAAEKTVAAAGAIAERMSTEVANFTEFLQRANDSEKANLRLEVEKLRRTEADWLQVLVRTLDHVYALHAGAVRSGQPQLIEQLGHFQNACREAARRVGLTPFAAAPQEAFDPQRHQVLDGEGKAPEGAAVAETVATGYTFQGRLLRPVLVRVAPLAEG